MIHKSILTGLLGMSLGIIMGISSMIIGNIYNILPVLVGIGECIGFIFGIIFVFVYFQIQNS